MKIGYTTWGMPKVPIDQALEYLAGLGFDAVEPAVIPGFTTELDTLDAGERQRIRDLFDGYGLHMPAVAGHLSLMERDPRAHAENWRRLQGEVELCAEWARGEDAPTLDTVVGGRPQDWEGARDLIVERTKALAEYAAGWGVIVSLEPHIGNALETPEQAAWLIEEIDSPYLRLNFDISHFDILGLDMAQTVARLAPYAAHTHVKDQRGRAPDFEFLIPGEGPFDFVAYLREMDKAGYTGSITAEVSFMVQKRPDYDPFAAAELCYRTLERAFARSGVARD
jgi:inosose dehydratase